MVGSTLFFAATDGSHGPELWKSDGTTAGTVMVKDVYPGAIGSYPKNLVNVNGTLFYQAFDPQWGIRAVPQQRDVEPEPTWSRTSIPATPVRSPPT